MHFEQAALLSTLQVRGSDKVLDLGTGSGILALECVRRGATAVGVDTNDRALAIARLSARINGLSARVSFEHADICDVNIGELNRPSLVVSNPPFEPALEAQGLPKHSYAGADGVEVLELMLQALAQWRHRPDAIQLVLFSVGLSKTSLAPGERGEFNAETLRVAAPLKRAADALHACLEMREMAAPIRFQDVIALQHGQSVTVSMADRWLSALRKEREATEPWLHLLVASLLPGEQCSAPIVQDWRSGRKGDECFLWPTCLPDIDATESVYRLHLDSVINSRETELEGNIIDLAFDKTEIQRFLRPLVLEGGIFGRHNTVTLLDVSPENEQLRLLHFDRTLALPHFAEVDGADLKAFLKSHYKSGILGATSCSVFSEHPHLRVDLLTAGADELVDRCTRLGETLQRFVAVSDWPRGCLPPARQDTFKNLLSELATRAELVRRRTSNLAIVVAHEFKNLTCAFFTPSPVGRARESSSGVARASRRSFVRVLS